MVIINARTMSPEAIAEAKAFAEKENLCGVVRWIGGAFFYRASGSQVLLLVFCFVFRFYHHHYPSMMRPISIGRQKKERSAKRKWRPGVFIFHE